MKGALPGGLPGKRPPIRPRPLGAKEIDSQSVAIGGWAGVDGLVRNPHKARPDLCGLVDSSGDLESGIPHPRVFVARRIEIDIQVDPLPLRGDFEFPIPADVFEVGAYENLRYVPLPKFVSLSRCGGIRLQIELLVGADEQKVEISVRPSRSNFRPVSRHGITAATVVEINSRTAAPEGEPGSVSASISRGARLLSTWAGVAAQAQTTTTRQSVPRARASIAILPLRRNGHQPRGILPIYFAQDLFRQSDARDPPTALWRYGRRGVVEILIFGFKEPVVDLVERFAEDLLRRGGTGMGGGGEHNPVLEFIEELARHPRLAGQVAGAGGDVDAHVGMCGQAFRNVRQIFRVGDVEADELGAWVAPHDMAAGLLELTIAGEIPAMKRPGGVGVQLLPTLIETVDGEEEGL